MPCKPNESSSINGKRYRFSDRLAVEGEAFIDIMRATGKVFYKMSNL
jgi:hypothetical protein